MAGNLWHLCLLNSKGRPKRTQVSKLKPALAVSVVVERAAPSTPRDPIKYNGTDKLPQYFPPLS